MGMDLVVSLGKEGVPDWDRVREILAQRGLAVQMRMIDGELAFPDEKPPSVWRELRVATPAGMVTLRREADRIVCVIWGNADESLRRDWQTLAEAVGQAAVNP